jgi:outer membrane protein assembly factor BamB
MTPLHSRRAFLRLLGAAAGASGAAAGSAAGAAGTPPGNATATSNRTATPRNATTTPAPTGTPGPVAPTGAHPTFGVGPARTGVDPDARAPEGPVRSAWCVPADGADRLTSLAVADGVVLVGTPSDGLRALDAATGERLWRTAFESYPGAPTVVGDRVYVGDRRAVHALGSASGRVLWSTDPGTPVTSSVLATGRDGTGARRAFVATGREADEDGERTGSVVHAFDAGDGTTRWSTAVERGTVYGALAAREGLVYAGTAGRSVHAFDAADGAVRWSVEVGEHAVSPAVGRESVFVGDQSGRVHARNRWTGAERWTYDAGAEVRASPAVDDDTVYVAATDGVLHALDAGSGRRRWRFDGGRRLVVAPTVVGGGAGADGGADADADAPAGATVLVGSGSGNVFAVDAATGEPRWSHQLPDGAATSPVAVDGWLYAGDGEGRLHALVDDSTPVPDAARACAAPPADDPRDATRDADDDGVPDREDYAPRDGSVQRRSDLRAVVREADDDGDGFLRGVGLGAVASLVGVGAGWWLGRRGGGDGSGDGSTPDDGGDGDDGDAGADGAGNAEGGERRDGAGGGAGDGDGDRDGEAEAGRGAAHPGRRVGPWMD